MMIMSLLLVQSDTLSDMVSHMTDSVGLVHQMPFSCDRPGMAAVLEKVSNLMLFKGCNLISSTKITAASLVS